MCTSYNYLPVLHIHTTGGESYPMLDGTVNKINTFKHMYRANTANTFKHMHFQYVKIYSLQTFQNISYILLPWNLSWETTGLERPQFYGQWGGLSRQV